MKALLTRASATAQVLVKDLELPELLPDDAHHLTKVLRVRDGESVVATDGYGRWRVCEWHNQLVVRGDLIAEAEPPPAEVAFALTKGDKPEWTVQKLTELGITRIIPFVSERTIVKWDAEKTKKHVARFERIAYEAAMQSRRVWLPVVESVTVFDDIGERGFALAAPGGHQMPLVVDKIAVGPEGGWSESELQRARIHVSLGSTILRAETAALVAAVLVAQRFVAR